MLSKYNANPEAQSTGYGRGTPFEYLQRVKELAEVPHYSMPIPDKG